MVSKMLVFISRFSFIEFNFSGKVFNRINQLYSVAPYSSLQELFPAEYCPDVVQQADGRPLTW